MLEYLTKMIDNLIARDYTCDAIAFDSMFGVGTVLAVKVGTDNSNREYIVWTFDTTGATFHGYYSPRLIAARDEFKRRIVQG